MYVTVPHVSAIQIVINTVIVVKTLKKPAYHKMKVMIAIVNVAYMIQLQQFLFVSGNPYLLVANILYIHRVSMDGSRIKTVYSTNSMESIIAIDYDYR